jgi:hypothetical protein
MKPQELRELTDKCIQWYWEHGHKRSDQYEVSRGSCLDPLYAIRDRAAAIERSGLTPKPCMALWGPSQTGKSTLLSGYLDVEGDVLGHQSALKWSEADPVRFGGELLSDGSNTVVNPYNGGADGSGCISRFVMLDTVPDPAFPVELTLATDTQILHALAAGYESECKPQNKQGDEVSWGQDNFRTLVDAVRSAGPPDEGGFEALHRLADVLDLLIKAGIRRYANLATHWSQTLRPMLMNHPHLANRKALREFSQELLWDSWPSLNALCERLQTKRAQLIGLWGSAATLRCSWRLAALLLDIDAYKHYNKVERPAVKAFVDALSFRAGADGAIAIGAGLDRSLMQSGEDFGLFQGLVWELRLPLRRDVLLQRSPAVAAFLEKADLMDFPGVSNEHEGAKKISNEVLAADLVRGLTEVLKRGKTASIAVSRAAELDIDGFSILARAGKHPGQPKQLVSGIQSWMLAYGQKWPPQSRAMPLNLVITFCSKLVNDVCSGGIRNGLDSYFSLFNKLADLADPRVVTLFTTTYPWLVTEGRIMFDEAKVKEKTAEIFADKAFQDRFGDNRESFEQMVANGGTDYFFRSLTQQASGSKRPSLLAQRLEESQQRLVELMSPHLPSKSAAQDERNRAIDAWIKAINDKMTERPKDEHEFDPAALLSRHLRPFLNIDPDELEALPTKAIERKFSIRSFIDKQFREWKASRGRATNVMELGFRDNTHAQRILAALVEAANHDAVVEFFRNNLGNLNSRKEAQDCRRFLAVRMNKELLHLPETKTDDDGAWLELLRALSTAEDEQKFSPESSPHFLSVIKPLIARLETIKSLQAGNRVPQAGDAELETLLPARAA